MGGDCRACVVSKSRSNKKEKKGGRKRGTLTPLSLERLLDADGETLRSGGPFSGPLRSDAQTGSWKKKNKAPNEGGQRSWGASGEGKAEVEAPGAQSSPRVPRPRAPPPSALKPPGYQVVLPKGRAASCRGRVSWGGGGGRPAKGELRGGGAGGGCAPDEQSRAGYRLPACSNFPVSWLRSLSNSRQSGHPEPCEPRRAQLHPAEPGAPQPHKRRWGSGRAGREGWREGRRGCGGESG